MGKPVASSPFTRTWLKIRYYARGLPPHQALLRILIDACAKLGVRVEPFHLVVEGLGHGRPPALASCASDYEVKFLTADDMPVLANIPGRLPTEVELRQRLREGKRCLGILRQGLLVAFTWCDLDTCCFETIPVFALKGNEAYLFDAYTRETARGGGLAPFMRYRLYEELAKLGRDRCYSITVLFNAPAARFKAKLGARVVELHLLIELFRRWRIRWVLHRYQHGRLPESQPAKQTKT